ncbi:MAG TPA: DUF3108 domain-containing protein [Myxococcales bacterium]|nr:DUF3108 domain-containing protein [Myxococcales bacterium]
MLALLLATLCPPQRLPAARFSAGEVLQYKLDALGADVGTFEVRAEPPPEADKERAVARLSSRAKTSAFISTNVARYEAYATALVARDFTPLQYREDVDENDIHRGTEVQFPDQAGPLPVKATKNGEPEPVSARADPGVRDMISTLYVLRLLPLGQPVCMEVFAGRKVWKLSGQMAARETIDTPLGRFRTLRFDGDAVWLDDPRLKRTAHVWVSDDDRHLPLVAVGEVRGKVIRAQLVSAPGARRKKR